VGIKFACCPGKMHGKMAFSLADTNTNIKKKHNLYPQNNYFFFLIVYHFKATYMREHIDTGTDRKHQKLSLDKAE